MTAQQFEQQCKEHDWFYEHQDSFEGWQYSKGEKAQARLREAKKDKPELQEIYDKYNPL